jgi:hypothetical protein
MMLDSILVYFVTAAGGGLTWFVYTLSNRVTAIETKHEHLDKQEQKIDLILAQLNEIKIEFATFKTEIRLEIERLKHN